MAKIIHILMSLMLVAANTSAAMPSCDSDDGECGFMQTELSSRDADVIDSHCCTCEHEDACISCCHSHNVFAVRLVTAIALPMTSQISADFTENLLDSAQPETDINRPPISSTAV